MVHMMLETDRVRVPSDLHARAAHYFWAHKERFEGMAPKEREAYLKRLAHSDRRKAEAMRGLFERHL